MGETTACRQRQTLRGWRALLPPFFPAIFFSEAGVAVSRLAGRAKGVGGRGGRQAQAWRQQAYRNAVRLAYSGRRAPGAAWWTAVSWWAVAGGGLLRGWLGLLTSVPRRASASWWQTAPITLLCRCVCCSKPVELRGNAARYWRMPAAYSPAPPTTCLWTFGMLRACCNKQRLSHTVLPSLKLLNLPLMPSSLTWRGVRGGSNASILQNDIPPGFTSAG